MMNEGVVVFISIEKQGKAPDLRHVTVGTTALNVSDQEFAMEALRFFQDSSAHDPDATYRVQGIHRFNSIDQYHRVLNKQLDEFIANNKS